MMHGHFQQGTNRSRQALLGEQIGSTAISLHVDMATLSVFTYSPLTSTDETSLSYSGRLQ